MRLHQIFFTTVVGIFLTLQASAQSTAQDGLSKLKGNLGNSKANLDDYKKNLKIVESNVSEAAKAKAQVEEQQVQATKALEENNQKIRGYEKNESELNQLILAEQKESQSEEQKIQELSKVVAQLRANQTLRNQNIAAYQEQIKQSSKEKTEWKTRGDQISKSSQNLDARAKALAQQESDWKNKQRGYVGEVNRWQKEVERQQKLNDNYNSLAEVKE